MTEPVAPTSGPPSDSSLPPSPARALDPIAAAETALSADAASDYDEEPFGPTEADLAEMYGGPPPREEDAPPSESGDLPALDEVKSRIPVKTQVLMEELFRARLEKVQRVNPKSIR